MNSTLMERARDAHRGLFPSALSPYFHTTDMREEDSEGNIRTIEIPMIKAFIFGYQPAGTTISAQVLLKDSDNVYTGCISLPLTVSTSDSDAAIREDVGALLATFCTTYSIPEPESVEWITDEVTPGDIPSGLANAPQAAITNAPADAVTNYNTITTLLGTVTGAVNTANTKQNEIAAKLNTLLSELRTLGLIST